MDIVLVPALERGIPKDRCAVYINCGYSSIVGNTVAESGQDSVELRDAVLAGENRGGC
jgi:hypothetical protein